MATQVERRNATRGAILRASIAAFEGGDLSASLESIAASAGVTKGSIHYHFTSRTGLLEAVASHTFTEIEKRIAARADAVEVETWVREVLEDQVSPRGRMLYAIADELARVGSLVGSDPFPYISLRLSEFDIAAPPTVVAAGGGLSISSLFLAGVVPGFLMCVCLAIAAYVIAVKHGYPSEPFPGVREVVITAAAALPGFITAVIIVGGVLSGVFTVTESGAFGAIYALVLTGLVYRSLSWESFKTAVVTSVRTTAMVMILIGCANAFGYLLALYDVPSLLASALTAISENPLIIILMINVILLALGMIMDMAALILICTPIFLPIAADLGMNPIQFGIMLLMNLGLGLCTPPVGVCLFVGCAVGKVPIEDAVKTIWPFYLAMLAALMLVAYVPAISLWLPGLFAS